MFVAVVVVADSVYQSHTVVSSDELDNTLAEHENAGVDADDVIQSPDCDTEEEAEAWVSEEYPESAGFENTDDDDEDESDEDESDDEEEDEEESDNDEEESDDDEDEEEEA